jgi:hypothetical protein
LITGLLAQDPRPAYKEGDDGKRFGMRLWDLNLRFKVERVRGDGKRFGIQARELGHGAQEARCVNGVKATAATRCPSAHRRTFHNASLAEGIPRAGKPPKETIDKKAAYRQIYLKIMKTSDASGRPRRALRGPMKGDTWEPALSKGRL